MKIYEEPLVGFACADDELFITELKKEGVIHPEYLTPLEWLHARIEGQIFLNKITDYIQSILANEGLEHLVFQKD